MNKLRFWRLERELSQIELAAASGVGRWAIQLYEMGVRAPKEDEQVALSYALGVDQAKLFPVPMTSQAKPGEAAV